MGGQKSKRYANSCTSLLHGYGVALVAVGDADGVNARKPMLRKIFSTFGFGESEKDRRLIGTWQYENTYFSGTTIRHMIFQTNDAFRSGTRLLASSDAGTVDSGGESGEHGQWSAGNETLYLIWDDGSITEYGYYIEGQPGAQKMLLKPTDGSRFDKFCILELTLLKSLKWTFSVRTGKLFYR